MFLKRQRSNYAAFETDLIDREEERQIIPAIKGSIQGGKWMWGKSTRKRINTHASYRQDGARFLRLGLIDSWFRYRCSLLFILFFSVHFSSLLFCCAPSSLLPSEFPSPFLSGSSGYHPQFRASLLLQSWSADRVKSVLSIGTSNTQQFFVRARARSSGKIPQGVRHLPRVSLGSRVKNKHCELRHHTVQCV